MVKPLRSTRLDSSGPRRRGFGAFTLVELLVVIGIITILGGLLLSSVIGTRRIAREAKCRNNLNQLATAIQVYHDSYGDGVYLPPWLTWLQQYPVDQPILADPRVFICPDDKSIGAEGGRPRALKYAGTGAQIEPWLTADIDRGNLKGLSGSRWGGNGVVDPQLPSSYFFEMNSEPCEYYYDNFGSSFPQEWDLDKNTILSWYEFKMTEIRGTSGVRGLGGQVPMVRCFWHADEPYLDDADWVMNIRYDFSVYKGHPVWQHDSPE